MLTMLTEQKAIAGAQRQVTRALRRGATKCKLLVGYQGGSETDDAYWRPLEGIWFVDQPNRLPNRTWLAFGTTKPGSRTSPHPITCEINVPFRGVDRRIAGAYAIDPTGSVCLTHNGKVGGGRPGISKQAFRDWYPNDLQALYCPDDGQTDDVIIIGQVAAKELPRQIADFVRHVERFKSLVVRGRLERPLRRNRDFVPEFSGRRRPYRPGAMIEAVCRHGAVVNELYRLLTKASFDVRQDQRDLFLVDDGDQMVALFEAKTESTTSSLYCGIGQLEYYSAAADCTPLRILVVPPLTARTGRVVQRLGIRILEFEWRSRQPPRFRNIEGLIRTLREIGAK